MSVSRSRAGDWSGTMNPIAWIPPNPTRPGALGLVPSINVPYLGLGKGHAVMDGLIRLPGDGRADATHLVLKIGYLPA